MANTEMLYKERVEKFRKIDYDAVFKKAKDFTRKPFSELDDNEKRGVQTLMEKGGLTPDEVNQIWCATYEDTAPQDGKALEDVVFKKIKKGLETETERCFKEMEYNLEHLVGISKEDLKNYKNLIFFQACKAKFDKKFQNANIITQKDFSIGAFDAVVQNAKFDGDEVATLHVNYDTTPGLTGAGHDFMIIIDKKKKAIDDS
jgi:hypothetical protein